MKRTTEGLRALMPALQNKQYFNYGGQGPLPTPSLNAITKSWGKIQDLGPFTNNIWPYIAEELNRTRIEFSNICGVKSDRIAFTENVTAGCINPLWGLPFNPNDHLLIGDCEHPGIVAACKELAKRNQLTIDYLPVEKLRHNLYMNQSQAFFKVLEEKLHPKTRLVVLSHVLWNTGQIMPISSVVQILRGHPHKPFLLVDAAQSFCQIPIEEAANQADIYAFTGHKWACGPEGLGGVVISERVLSEANPTFIGWRSLQHERNLTNELVTPFHTDSRRFEVATSCTPLLAGLRCSLNLLRQEGTANERINTIRALSTILFTELQQIKGVKTILEDCPSTGLVSFHLPPQFPTKQVVKTLGKKGLFIRDLDQPSCLRACVHITTTRDEVFSLVEGLKTILNSYSIK